MRFPACWQHSLWPKQLSPPTRLFCCSINPHWPLLTRCCSWGILLTELLCSLPLSYSELFCLTFSSSTNTNFTTTRCRIKAKLTYIKLLLIIHSVYSWHTNSSSRRQARSEMQHSWRVCRTPALVVLSGVPAPNAFVPVSPRDRWRGRGNLFVWPLVPGRSTPCSQKPPESNILTRTLETGQYNNWL